MMTRRVSMALRAAVATVVVAAGHASADVFTYECNALPEDRAWVRSDRLFPPDRWIDDGWFFQHAEIVSPGPPAVGEDDYYERTLADFEGEATFFVEWRMETDGPENFADVAPAGLVASGNAGIYYHFTIAADRVRYIDSDLNLYFFDIEPGVPHTYRLELYGVDEYVFYIDGEVVHLGTPEGAYPTIDSCIVFGTRASIEDNTTRWDYTRFGTLPQDASGDYDSDEDVDARDFYFFEECFSGRELDAGPGCRWADFDGDTDVDCEDWESFKLAWTGEDDPPDFSACPCASCEYHDGARFDRDDVYCNFNRPLSDKEVKPGSGEGVLTGFHPNHQRDDDVGP